MVKILNETLISLRLHPRAKSRNVIKCSPFPKIDNQFPKFTLNFISISYNDMDYFYVALAP